MTDAITRAAAAACLDQLARLQDFAADLRAQGIHVGMGPPPSRCVTCYAEWPCASATDARRPEEP